MAEVVDPLICSTIRRVLAEDRAEPVGHMAAMAGTPLIRRRLSMQKTARILQDYKLSIQETEHAGPQARMAPLRPALSAAVAAEVTEEKAATAPLYPRHCPVTPAALAALEAEADMAETAATVMPPPLSSAIIPLQAVAAEVTALMAAMVTQTDQVAAVVMPAVTEARPLQILPVAAEVTALIITVPAAVAPTARRKAVW